jgi:hypothetical protein
MSGVIPSHGVVVVREGDAEVLGSGPVTGRLYADSSATGGALSSQRITLLHGAAGATPHHHTGSSELFYVSGEAPLESILEVQDLYDNHFNDSPVWQQALAARL